MLFNSYVFIFAFLPIAVIGYYLIGSIFHPRRAQLWLIMCSLFFYGWWDWRFLGLLLPSIGLNYLIGRRLILDKGDREDGLSRRGLMVLGVVLNLLSIAYFKYAGFLTGILSDVSGYDFNLGHVVLPLAISFFTFQQIAFLVDAYRRKAEDVNFQNYVLFVTFFPQLIAGPIVHHAEMMPQFEERGRAFKRDPGEIALGLSIFSVGLFKKVILADSFALFATPVFERSLDGASLDLLTAWSGALAYTFQLYFDFSGYSDMAIGLGLLFGISLPLNFFSPYKATSIIEFWRRWHMTLSRFLRDYLYIALGGNRKGQVRRYVNLLVTMLLGGLWHGAGWTYVLWGGLHGFYLILNHGWHRISRKSLSLQKVPKRLRLLTAQGLTFLAVVVAWVLFRAETFTSAMTVLEGMVRFDDLVLPIALRGVLGPVLPALEWVGVEFGSQGGGQFVQVWLLILVGFVVTLGLPNVPQIFHQSLLVGDRTLLDENPPKGTWGQLLQWQPTTRWAIMVGFVLYVGILGLTQVSEFLYFQF